jgi:hypothetical protein
MPGAAAPRLARRSFVLASTAALVAMRASIALGDGDLAAEALFREGREHMDKQDYATACAKFTESERLDPAPGTLLNIAECSEKLGRTATAWKSYAEAADRLDANDDRRPYALQRRDALATHLPRLHVDVRQTGAGCRLYEDDVEVGQSTWGDALPADPGPHELKLACPHHKAAIVRAAVATEGQSSVEISPGEAEKEGGGSSGLSAVSVVGWVLGGVGLGTLGAGLVTGGLVLDRKSKVDSLCTHTMPPRCPPDGVAAASQGKTLSAVSTATFVSGLVLLGTGVTLVVVGATSNKPSPSAALVVGPTFVGARGAF